MYAYDSVSTQYKTVIIKGADDTAILGLIKDAEDSGYREPVDNIQIIK